MSNRHSLLKKLFLEHRFLSKMYEFINFIIDIKKILNELNFKYHSNNKDTFR